MGVGLSQTAKGVLHFPPETNTGSQLVPALSEKQVVASAFHSPPQLNRCYQDCDHCQRKSYTRLASKQTMYTN